MALLTATGWMAATVFCREYMAHVHKQNRFYLFWLMTLGATMGVFLSGDLFTAFLFFEIMSFTSFVLVVQTEEYPALKAGETYLAVAVIGGLAALTGLFLLYHQLGTLSLDAMAAAAAGAEDRGLLWVGGLLVLVGFGAKAGAFPLHIWLPDAMEGPTPVSALIHAATMVVAGVYLVARMFPLFIDYAPHVLHLVAYVGAFTAFYAASVACVQSDIKRVLAFSTISQIGFMMVALGVCTSMNPHEGGLGYMAGMFHLFTHAMFKALLFLGAGSIIHAVHSNEMSAMGGLRKYMPITHITFLIACLAIAGIPPFSGFFSKDEILTACFQFSPAMGWIMTVIAAMTAFYMFRLYYGIFWSDRKSAVSDEHAQDTEHAHHTPHESPLTMTVPLMFLAVVTVVAGFIPFGRFISSNGEAYTIHLDWGVAGTSIAIAVISIALATYMYKSGKQPVANALARRFNGLWTAAYHRFYIDEVYQFITHRIIFGCISRPIAWWDRHVVDGFFDFLAWGANATSDEIRGLQSGRIQQYTFVFLLGTLILILLLLL